jgi:TolB-like protein/DNA-binding winged helix-turn-helix (wHTH) protein/Flp pilus assembly protein TadD
MNTTDSSRILTLPVLRGPNGARIAVAIQLSSSGAPAHVETYPEATLEILRWLSIASQKKLKPRRTLKKQQFYQFGPFRLQADPPLLWRDGARVALPLKSLDLLLVLVANAGELVEKHELMQRVWPNTFVEEGNLTQGISLLRKALEEGQGQQTWIETVPKRGYRFAPTVAEVGSVENGAADRPPASRRKLLAVLSVVCLCLAGLAVVLYIPLAGLRGRTTSPGAMFKKVQSLRSGHVAVESLLVLPLRNLSGDTQQEYFADGMTESLIGELAKIGSLRVISRTSAMHYKNTTKLLPEIAGELKVDAVVEGSVAESGDRVRISVQLIYVPLDRHLWTHSYERKLTDVLSLQREIAVTIAHQILNKTTPSEQRRLAEARPVDRQAQLAYLRASYLYWNRRTGEELSKAIEYLQAAIKADPSYAPAYARLARCYHILSTVYIAAQSPAKVRPMELAAAEKALNLDPELAEAHSALASLQHEQCQWAAAEKSYRRAIEINPNAAEARAGYAQMLAATGRFDEALRESQQARELDPVSPVIGTSLGFVLHMARRHDQSIQEFLRVRDIDANYYGAAWFLSAAYAANSQYEESIEMAKRAVTLSQNSPGALGTLGWAYGMAGRKAEARRVLDQLYRLSRARYVPAASILYVYIGLDDREKAFEWLEKAYQESSYVICYLKALPAVDSLRTDSRFRDLLRRIGLADQ